MGLAFVATGQHTHPNQNHAVVVLCAGHAGRRGGGRGDVSDGKRVGSVSLDARAFASFAHNTRTLSPKPNSLHRYAAPSVPPHARAIVLAAWTTSASVVALVPVDVYTALRGDAPGALPGLWAAAYWTTQVSYDKGGRQSKEEGRERVLSMFSSTKPCPPFFFQHRSSPGPSSRSPSARPTRAISRPWPACAPPPWTVRGFTALLASRPAPASCSCSPPAA